MIKGKYRKRNVGCSIYRYDTAGRRETVDPYDVEANLYNNEILMVYSYHHMNRLIYRLLRDTTLSPTNKVVGLYKGRRDLLRYRSIYAGIYFGSSRRNLSSRLQPIVPMPNKPWLEIFFLYKQRMSPRLDYIRDYYTLTSEFAPRFQPKHIVGKTNMLKLWNKASRLNGFDHNKMRLRNPDHWVDAELQSQLKVPTHVRVNRRVSK